MNIITSKYDIPRNLNDESVYSLEVTSKNDDGKDVITHVVDYYIMGNKVLEHSEHWVNGKLLIYNVFDISNMTITDLKDYLWDMMKHPVIKGVGTTIIKVIPIAEYLAITKNNRIKYNGLTEPQEQRAYYTNAPKRTYKRGKSNKCPYKINIEKMI